jgi:FkbM family methyltransferase
MNLDNFIWEPNLYPTFKETIINEIFEQKIYERMFPVEEGDVVLDIGASLGPFTFSILHKKPKHVFALEPSYSEFKTLVLNTLHGNVTPINKGIGAKVGEFEFDNIFLNDGVKMYSTTFTQLIDDYNIKTIDFLKTDCEGGEYDIFTPDNLIWIKQNVKKIAGEWHLTTPELKEKFRAFRDTYLRIFHRHQVYSVDAVNITWDLWNDNFLNYYSEVILYIDNQDYL